jgi:hypothetical protein
LGAGFKRAETQMVHIDRLLEEGADSTEVAAALLQIPNGGDTAASAAQQAKEAKPAAPREETAEDHAPAPDEPPRKAKTGKAWLRVGLGRDAVRNPRDIVDLLVEAAGLPSREVGFIALGNDASYAEVPFDFTKGLSPSGNVLQGSHGDVTIWPVAGLPKKKRR